MCDRLTTHSSDANTGLESNRSARLADLKRTLLNFFKETDNACSGVDIPLIERIIADIKTVGSDISTTDRPLIHSCIERIYYIQVDALRLRYNPLIGDHSNQRTIYIYF